MSLYEQIIDRISGLHLNNDNRPVASTNTTVTNRTYRSVDEIIPHITNPYQRDNLRKLLSTYEEDKVYLENYASGGGTGNGGGSRRNATNSQIEGTFAILGSYNYQKGYRSEYAVRMYKNGSFWCSCPDHKFNSIKKGTVCKHICFVVCRVGKILDPGFFETKKLTEEQLAGLVSKAGNVGVLLQDWTVCRPDPAMTRAMFEDMSKDICEDDMCPVCFNEMVDGDGVLVGGRSILSCPACKNYVHKDCMMVWLEKKDTCVYCRSDVWATYNA